jgi:hypothetical protein
MVELFPGDLESFWCQATGTGRDWGTYSDDVVCDVVFDRRVRRAYLCESRQLREKIEVGITCVFWSDGGAGGGVLRGNSLDMEVSGRVHELALSHIDQESKVPKEVCSDDQLRDVCDKEYPLEVTAKTEVERK